MLGLFLDLKLRGFPPIKPCFGSDLVGHCVVRIAAVEDAEGEAISVEYVFGKSSRRLAWRAREPFAALAAMTNKQGRGMTSFDEAKGGCRVACVEDFGNSLHDFEIQLGYLRVAGSKRYHGINKSAA